MTKQSTSPLPPIHAFRAGRHVDSRGNAHEWTERDLAELADSYDPALREAPVTIGHPAGNAPAWGWIGKVQAKAKDLFTQPSQLQPEFQDMLKRGLFKKVSISVYGRAHPNNPKPGQLYLRHVGFLGAQPPAVAGLADYSFAEADAGGDLQVYEFGDWSDRRIAEMFAGLRDWLISRFGLEEAEQAMPRWGVQSLTEEALRPDDDEETPTALPSYSEGASTMPNPNAADLAAREAAVAARETDLQAREAQLQQRESAAQHAQRMAQFSEFADGLVRDGRLRPADKARVVAVLAALPQAQMAEFSEGEGAQVMKPATEVLQGFLAGLPKLVEFGEVARPDAATKPAIDVTDGVAIGKAAAEYMEAELAAGRNVTLDQAVQHIVSTHTQEA